MKAFSVLPVFGFRDCVNQGLGIRHILLTNLNRIRASRKKRIDTLRVYEMQAHLMRDIGLDYEHKFLRFSGKAPFESDDEP